MKPLLLLLSHSYRAFCNPSCPQDPATPLSTVLARLQHVQPQYLVGPKSLQQLAAAVHRTNLSNALLALHDRLCKDGLGDALTKSVDHGLTPEGLPATNNSVVRADA